MALTKVSGSIIKDSVSLSGNVSVGGTLTYQDVTNVDALGIGTFRAGIDVTGGDLIIPDKIIHSGDTNTTIRFPAADTITAETAGSERLRIDSSGRVMMGTTAASTLTSTDDLTISTSGSTGITLFSAAGNAGNITFGDGTSGDDRQRGLLQYHHSDNTMRFFTNAARRMTITSDGKVGINETSPDRQLHVRSDGVAAAKLGGESGSAYYMEIGQLASSGSPGFNATGTNSSMLFQINGSEKFRIKNNGNLDMTGGGVIILNDNQKLYFEGDNDDDFNCIGRQSSENSLVITARSNLANIIDSNNDDTSAYWSVRHNGTTVNSSSELMRVQSNGRVGINQNNPDRLLEVTNDNAAAAKFGGTAGGQDFSIEIGQLSSSSSAGFNATGGSGSSMLFRNNGTELMRLNSSNNGGGVGIQTSNSGNAKSLNVYTPGSGDGKYAMQIENGYGSGAGGNVLKMKSGRGDGTIDVDLIRLELYNNTRIFSIDNSGLMRFRSGCGSGSQDALAVYGVRAWINFSSINNSIRGKGGLSGISDRGTGQFTYNFSTSLPDGNYTVTCNSGNSNGGTSNRNRMSAYSLTTANFKIDDFDSGAGNTPGYTDRQMVHVMVVR